MGDEGSLGVNHVLMVCYANQCRSPMMEAIMRSYLGWEPPSQWSVSSAGTNASVGTSTHPLALRAVHEQGIPIQSSGTHQVTPAMLASVDLVLTAERDHRAVVARMYPPAVQYTFTLRQLARLCSAARTVTNKRAVNDVADLMQLASIGRPLVQPVPTEEDDIEDPMGSDLSVFRQTAQLIASSVRDILG